MSDTNDQPGGSTGLLDNVTAEDTTKTASNEQKVEINHKASADGATMATDTGAAKLRPEYLPENFWNPDKGEADLEAMSKSWSDLRKQISQGKHKAPADGKYDLKALGDKPNENPLTQTLLEMAKDEGLSQAAFDKIASQLAPQVAPEIDTQAELKSLGPNGNAIVNGMVDWARGMVNKGVWSGEDFEEFKVMGGTAKGLRALMKIREAYEGRVPLETTPMEGAPSKEELYQMVGDPKYKTDAAYRQKVERLFQTHMQ
jgi:hypothetical protein